MQIVKYKKQYKKKFNTVKTEFLGTVQVGSYGLKAISSGFLTAKQLETARRVIARITKRTGKILIRVFFNQPLTKKPLLTRMGKGSGPIKNWVLYVKKGIVILETNNISKKLAFKAFKAASLRLPVNVDFVSREVYSKVI